MIKTVIRIEHPLDGKGIFLTRVKGRKNEYSWGNFEDLFDYCVDNIGDVHNKHLNMNPASWIPGFTSKHHCAYPSVEVMKKWINCGEIKQLLSLGFVVLVLDVTDYIETSEQVIYTKESIVSSKDISSLF